MFLFYTHLELGTELKSSKVSDHKLGYYDKYIDEVKKLYATK